MIEFYDVSPGFFTTTLSVNTCISSRQIPYPVRGRKRELSAICHCPWRLIYSWRNCVIGCCWRVPVWIIMLIYLWRCDFSSLTPLLSMGDDNLFPSGGPSVSSTNYFKIHSWNWFSISIYKRIILIHISIYVYILIHVIKPNPLWDKRRDPYPKHYDFL